MNNDDRRQWIDNDEGLYQWWRRSGLSKAAFIRENRQTLDECINKVRSGNKPAHYLAYRHDSACMCYGCQERRRNNA